MLSSGEKDSHTGNWLTLPWHSLKAVQFFKPFLAQHPHVVAELDNNAKVVRLRFQFNWLPAFQCFT
jgi:hypothetical protein